MDERGERGGKDGTFRERGDKNVFYDTFRPCGIPDRYQLSIVPHDNQMVEVRVCIENPPKQTKEQFFFEFFLFQHFSFVTSRKDPKPCLDHDICTIDVRVTFLKYVSESQSSDSFKMYCTSSNSPCMFF